MSRVEHRDAARALPPPARTDANAGFVATPEPRFVGQGGWVLSALPGCFTQQSSTEGPSALVAPEGPQDALRIAPGELHGSGPPARHLGISRCRPPARPARGPALPRASRAHAGLPARRTDGGPRLLAGCGKTPRASRRGAFSPTLRRCVSHNATALLLPRSSTRPKILRGFVARGFFRSLPAARKFGPEWESS